MIRGWNSICPEQLPAGEPNNECQRKASTRHRPVPFPRLGLYRLCDLFRLRSGFRWRNDEHSQQLYDAIWQRAGRTQVN